MSMVERFLYRDAKYVGFESRMRFFSAACARTVEHLISPDHQQELATALREIERDGRRPSTTRWSPDESTVLARRGQHLCGLRLLCHLNGISPLLDAVHTAELTARMLLHGRSMVSQEQVDQLKEVRFAPIANDVLLPSSFDSSWPQPAPVPSEDCDVVRSAILKDRRWSDACFLADALEDAHYEHAQVIEHLRKPDHWPGCWALQLLQPRTV